MRAGAEELRALLAHRAGRAAVAAVAAALVAALAGLALLWPAGDAAPLAPSGLVVRDVTPATVTAVRGAADCEAFAGPDCRLVELELGGEYTGSTSYLTLPGDLLAPPLAAGDRIRVARNDPAGTDPATGDPAALPPAISDPAQQPFAFVDYERRAPMLVLALAFALAVLAIGRFQGLRSLVALALSLALLVQFVIAAILDGRPPLAVALVGGFVVMAVTMVLTHGPGAKTIAALLGTTVALALTALLALAAVEAAQITGLSSEQSTLLAASADAPLSIQGLVLAGMIIGALGVLDDVTISQASTVLALRRAHAAASARHLFGEAMRVGRDHVGATVNTLVLAYAGAALPVLLILADQRVALGEGLNREVVAQELVAMMVGSLGLIAAVPLTTFLAAALAVRLPRDAVPEGGGHVH